MRRRATRVEFAYSAIERLSRLHSKTIICSLGLLCIFALLTAAVFLRLEDAYVTDLSNRLAPSSPAHLLGTDEMGRDLLARFIAGTRYTILIGLMTTLLAGASGYLADRAARIAPNWIGRPIAVLAYICFLAPSFLLAPRWPNRLLMAGLCVLGILPLFIIGLIVLLFGNLTGGATTLVLGPLWGVGIAYIIRRANHLAKPDSQAGGDNAIRPSAALMASVFAWAVYLQAVLDVLGLGVRPPASSWGSMLIAQGISLWPQAIAILGFLIIGTTAFSLSDMISRARDGNHIPGKREEASQR